ncbi:type II toxin-antitoxin system ParD family antitoxin [bacterium]|nr:MAG: type II toxin-antitoxin system ParD family antitoxin [bacterium]
MNVSLTPELERLVQEKVASGLYNSASEVVREALRILKERDEMRSLALEDLRREIAAGLDELDRGEAEVLDIEAIKAEGRRRMAV